MHTITHWIVCTMVVISWNLKNKTASLQTMLEWNLRTFLKLRHPYSWNDSSQIALNLNVINHGTLKLQQSVNGLQVALCEWLAGKWGGTGPMSSIYSCPLWRWNRQSQNVQVLILIVPSVAVKRLQDLYWRWWRHSLLFHLFEFKINTN